jgi:release factor glutamine methyltransferase
VANRSAFICGEGLSPWVDETQPQFDLLVTNPPYIPWSDYQGLAEEVRHFEPRQALLGDPRCWSTENMDNVSGELENPLYLYEAILSDCHRVLKPGGFLYWEIDPPACARLQSLMGEAGFEGVTVGQDAGGLDRWMGGQYWPKSVKGPVS